MGRLNESAGATTSAGEPSADGLTNEQETLLQQSLAPLDLVETGLSIQALAFVLRGDHETVLLALQTLQSKEPGGYLGKPGRLLASFDHRTKDAWIEPGKKSLAARAKLYEQIAAASPPIGLLVRLAKLLAAADGGRSLLRPGAPVPDWLQYLVNDAIAATFNIRFATDIDLQVSRPGWDASLFARLLAHDGLDESLALLLIFERVNVARFYRADCLDGILRPPWVADYLLAHRSEVEALPARLSPTGRFELARRIGSDKPLLQVFTDIAVRLAADTSKAVRDEAVLHLDGIDEPRRLALLSALLQQGNADQRAHAAALIARLCGDAAAPVLKKALTNEAGKSVQQSIRAALNRLATASDAAAVALPEPPPWQPIAESRLGDEAMPLLLAARADLIERERLDAAAEAEANKTRAQQYHNRQKHYERVLKIRDGDLGALVRMANGDELLPSDPRASPPDTLLPWDLNRLGDKLRALPTYGPSNLIRWLAANRRPPIALWSDATFQQWLAWQPGGVVDLRALADLLQRCGVSVIPAADAALRQHLRAPSATELLPVACVWPFFAEHPEFIDQGLGLAASSTRESNLLHDDTNFDLSATLRTIACFPSVPARWLPRLMELALGDAKTHRASAQRVLSTVPDIGRRVAESLDHSNGEVRILAAHWLAEVKDAQTIPALTRTLDKESRETVRAALLTAMEALGCDISPRLAPAVLLAEAKKGLKAKPPAGLAWFALTALPHCHWTAGDAVDPDVIRWWVVLACKLKEPGGNALLTRYLGLLDPRSRQALGRAVLLQFIAWDTSTPSLEDATAFAAATAPARWQGYQASYLRADPKYRSYYEANYNKTQEQVFEECKRDKLGEYLGSAIGEKGILALTAFAPGHEAVAALQQYMRDHYPRRAQIEAMIEGIAPGGDPLVIQFLLGLSRRYRTASVKDKARALVQQIAERNGWSADQLADRTIPTAGLDDGGALSLTYGDRSFGVRLDAAMKLELRNLEGKLLKALPEPRQSDDAALAKEAKAQFATARKELKQVVDAQTARLFEAMCSGRCWPQQEWRDYLQAHPIVGRLIQRLVWLELAPDGSSRGSLRPSDDGSLLDAQDDEVELANDSQLRLAHASLVDEATAAAWVRHFKDYKLQPLFPQMARPTRVMTAFVDAQGRELTEINDRLGWLSDTFTLRGSFNKFGYQRGEGEDGGFFSRYTKEFPSAGVRVVIEFSGSSLPEENVPAALKTLSFEDLKARRWGERGLALKSVPPVLLAEAHADYLDIARACAGFDADWERKIPW